MNWLPIVLYASLGLVCFGAGWVTSDWKNDADDKPILMADIEKQNRQIADLQAGLQDVIDKASQTVVNVQGKMDAVDAIVGQRNERLEMLTQRTRELGDEIGKLDPIGCVFTPSYRAMWLRIGTDANSNRDRLYVTPNPTAPN